MALLYQPKEGSVLICDFRGYEVPEIIKIRPVIVIRKHRTNKHHLQLDSHLHGANPICWAKCDIVATVSLGRLDRIKSKDRHGKRTYKIAELTHDQFSAIKAAVRSALGLR